MGKNFFAVSSVKKMSRFEEVSPEEIKRIPKKIENLLKQLFFSNLPDIYILLDGLSYNTRGYFASCVVFFRAPQGRGKMRAMSKMSASIIC